MKYLKIPKHSYAFIDGSYNPQTQIYGCGGFLIDQKGLKHIIQASGSDKNLIPLRNVAGEILGAKKAVKMAQKLNMKRLTLFYDYIGIAKWPLGEWKAKKHATKSYVKFIWDAAMAGLELYFVHVKSHNGIPGNVEADRLAKEAVGLIRKAA